jgi:peptidyl-prolyl cis-trans isomerase B (cyclophilin B)
LKRLAVIIGMMILAQNIGAKPLPRRDREPPQESRTPRVVMETNFGSIVIELDAEKAPGTVKNFLQYVDDRFYDGMVFHRVIPGFMIQGGGHLPGLKEKPGRGPVKNESDNGLSNARGSIAVARAADPDSGTSQFFINCKDNPFLDRARAADMAGYCVFGRVVEGMDVVDKIRQTPTGQRGGHSDVPLEDVVIRSARRLEK